MREIIWRSHYYRKIMNYIQCPIQKTYYKNLLFADIGVTLKTVSKIYNNIEIKNKINEYRQTKEFTLEELSKYDGAVGNPAYVAINGVVYDVSYEAAWGGGSHFGLLAGNDLTAQFNGCHGNIDILKNLLKVGIIK
ncbi:steroid-binding protein [Clostridium tetanomorphum]|uniref:Steroid-binding protein n=2 Tax=Clostridium tetanomorphum TaxID=1553 RepID=A0A923E930_CLOTT|nr:steroid-binding protein [Clostridium tetanomorphum]